MVLNRLHNLAIVVRCTLTVARRQFASIHLAAYQQHVLCQLWRVAAFQPVITKRQNFVFNPSHKWFNIFFRCKHQCTCSCTSIQCIDIMLGCPVILPHLKTMYSVICSWKPGKAFAKNDYEIKCVFRGFLQKIKV